MKKMLSFMGAFMGVLLMTGVSAHALNIETGNYRFILDDVDTFHDPTAPLPLQFPGWTNSGYTWGMADVQSYQVFQGGVWQTKYTRGQGGLYYFAVTGELLYNRTAPPGPGVFPHDSYMQNGPLVSGLNRNYLRLYELTADVWAAAVAAGPNPGANGAFGSFGIPILGGNLVVDARFNPNALVASGDGNAVVGDLLRSTSNTATQAAIVGWMDVIGGAWQALVDTNGQAAGSDIRISEDVYYQFDTFGPDRMQGTADDTPGPQWWTVPNNTVPGWESISVGQAQGTGTVIPEPGTVLLLGGGLIGLAGLGRLRKREK